MNLCCGPGRACLARGPHAAAAAARSSGDGAAAEAGSVPDALRACTRAAPLLMTVQMRDPVSCSLTPLRVRMRRSAARTLSYGGGRGRAPYAIGMQRRMRRQAAGHNPPRQRAGGCVRSRCAVLCGMEMAVGQTRHDVPLTSGSIRQPSLRGFADSGARPALRLRLAWHVPAPPGSQPVCVRLLHTGAIGTDCGEDEACCRLFGGQLPDDEVQHALFGDCHDFCLELHACLLPTAHRTRGSTDEEPGGGCSLMEGPA